MPLRDHFAPTIPMRFRWEGFHSLWAGTMVRHLNRSLFPSRYVAVPRVRLGTQIEIEDIFEVQVYDNEHGERLVAAVELISPGNKDRPQSRHDFVVKCANLLKAHVSLVLIDIVTDRHANLFKELMEYLEIRDSSHPLQSPIYCCSLLPRGSNGHARVDVWPEVLRVGAILPQLPLWLQDNLVVPLELEATYEETCGDLRA